MRKFSVVENAGWLPVLKIAKTIKSTFSPERLGIFDRKFARIISETLVFKDQNQKKKKKQL